MATGDNDVYAILTTFGPRNQQSGLHLAIDPRGSEMGIYEKENAPEAVSDRLKSKKLFRGSTPPDSPSVYVLMHMYTGLCPPSFFFSKILISPPPPFG